MNSTQCRRNVCKNADNPSIITRMANVKRDHAPNIKYTIIGPLTDPDDCKPIFKTMFHKTSDNSKEKYDNKNLNYEYKMFKPQLTSMSQRQSPQTKVRRCM